jgi:hypothetical protein
MDQNMTPLSFTKNTITSILCFQMRGSQSNDFLSFGNRSGLAEYFLSKGAGHAVSMYIGQRGCVKIFWNPHCPSSQNWVNLLLAKGAGWFSCQKSLVGWDFTFQGGCVV